mmetsp:Transcript_53609/g.151907  ORF Transcript_53609/g.151907 Transcript_53609/m.151907 type:complete len:267 (+) Transcript_53609:508-1308(+)
MGCLRRAVEWRLPGLRRSCAQFGALGQGPEPLVVHAGFCRDAGRGLDLGWSNLERVLEELAALDLCTGERLEHALRVGLLHGRAGRLVDGPGAGHRALDRHGLRAELFRVRAACLCLRPGNVGASAPRPELARGSLGRHAAAASGPRPARRRQRDPGGKRRPLRLRLLLGALRPDAVPGCRNLHHDHHTLGGVRSAGPTASRPFDEWARAGEQVHRAVVVGLVSEGVQEKKQKRGRQHAARQRQGEISGADQGREGFDLAAKLPVS